MVVFYGTAGEAGAKIRTEYVPNRIWSTHPATLPGTVKWSGRKGSQPQVLMAVDRKQNASIWF